MWTILVGLFGQRMDPTVIYYDNHSEYSLHAKGFLSKRIAMLFLVIQ